MKVSNWLKKRSLVDGIPDDISKFAKNENLQIFEELSVNLLKRYHQKSSGKSFFRLVRLLGFYGVIFYKKLEHYSGPYTENPKVLFVPRNHRNKKLNNCNIYPNTKSLLNSCGITSLYHLHGVPLESYNKLIGSHNLNDVKYSTFSPLEITTADKVSISFFNLSQKIIDYSEYNGEDIVCTSSEKLSDSDESSLSTEEQAPENDLIECLNLSVRTKECLKKSNIVSIERLIKCTKNDLLSIPNFGKTCLSEITNKLSELGVRLATIESKFDILDLEDDKILSKLNISIQDMSISNRTRNCFKKRNIEYVWQLIQLSEKDLLKIENLGSKSLTELKTIISDSSLHWGQIFLDEEIELIKSYEKTIDEKFVNDWFRINVKKLRSSSLSFLTDIENEIVQKRTFEIKLFKVTLEKLAQSYGLTRERIRQLEKKALKEIRQEFNPELRETTNYIASQLMELGNIANFEDINVNLNFLTSKEQEIVSQLIGLETNDIFIDWRYELISCRGPEFIENLCNDIKKEIVRDYNAGLFTINQLAHAVAMVSKEKSVFENEKYDNLTKKFLKKYKVSKEGKYLNLGKFTKIDKIALAFKELYPNGLEVYKNDDDLLMKIRDYDPKVFGDATHRSIVAHVINHPNILLWRRGYYIHENNISYDLEVIKEVISWIIKHFDEGNPRFQVSIPFIKFKEKLVSSGIPNQYALYSLIRKHEVDRIGQRKFPTLVDLEANVNLEEGIIEESEAFFLDQEKEVPYHCLKTEFVDNRGWKEYSVQQNICAKSEHIFPWRGNSYIHIDYLNVDYSKLNEFIQFLRAKLTSINSPYNLKGAKKEMSLLWEQTCPSATTRTITKLIRQTDPADLVIERNFIRLTDTSHESVSTEASLEIYFLERNEEITRYELKKEFIGNRGWTDPQLYTAIKNTHLFKSGNNSFIHPSTIHWNNELSQKVHGVLSRFLKERNSIQQTHMQIEELIYEYALPELSNGIQWTRQLLISVGNEFEEFLFFDNAYIFTDNNFDIEDLDDMIGFLVAREFPYGIAKTKEVEKLLWREGILLSGHKIPKNQFFDGSSICFSESNDEISLSIIGKNRYGKKK